MTFEWFADSGTDRFKNLGMMLSGELQSKIGGGGDLGRQIADTAHTVF